MSLHHIEEFLDDLHDLVRQCNELMEDDDIETSKTGIMENMRRIRDKADEVLEILLV